MDVLAVEGEGEEWMRRIEERRGGRMRGGGSGGVSEKMGVNGERAEAVVREREGGREWWNGPGGKEVHGGGGRRSER